MSDTGELRKIMSIQEDALNGYAERCQRAIDKALANQKSAIEKAVEGLQGETEFGTFTKRGQIVHRKPTNAELRGQSFAMGRNSAIDKALQAIKEATP